MANTLTGLLPTLYEALDIVSRELTGFIPAVTRNSSIERAAKDQTVRVPIAPAVSASTAISPGLYAPDTGDQTFSYTDITISKAQAIPIRWNGEEQRYVGTGGMYQAMIRDQFAQAMRTLVNEVETDIGALYKYASRAYGTSGTTPFASTLEDAAQVKKILDDNGAPQADRSLVVGTLAGVNLRKLANLTQVDAAGSAGTLRQGVLLPLFGIDIKESAKISAHTKGTATGMDCTAVEPIGETTIAVDGSNSGTILAGDVIVNTTEADGHKYVVQSATASGAASGNIVLAKPGLINASAINDEWTIQDSYTANLAFQRGAIQLVTRMPALPEGGDMADDRTTLVDPITGLAFEVAVYRQYRQVHYEIALAWGCAMIKPEHAAILLG